ncbi:DUF5996 family protein [Parasphingorhabdus sp. JC815]|uniref:DUF5996 family protein n=1 Tax=Parasphingorhabdus sp. JC815 TaxID=3232140 RepID=UPI003457B0D8
MTKDTLNWPAIPFDNWESTCNALHLWTQIVGKYRLSHTPWINHSWHATLYVTPRGLTTGPVPDGNSSISVSLDFHDHILVVECISGKKSTVPLEAMSIADFNRRLAKAIEAVDGTFDIHGAPNELEDATPFEVDTKTRPYDADAVWKFHRALVSIEQVFSRFRTGFCGKVSPVHLFWGSFDLAVTRFSGRTAPIHPGGIPNLPDDVTREAYSHEVSSAGFWPGQGKGEPMFYSYCYPVPDNFKDQSVTPDAAYWDDDLGEYLLSYEAVRKADDPGTMLMEFLQSTYVAAAETGDWDRDALECEIGEIGKPHDLGKL